MTNGRVKEKSLIERRREYAAFFRRMGYSDDDIAEWLVSTPETVFCLLAGVPKRNTIHPGWL